MNKDARIERSMKGLLDTMFDVLDGVIKGTTTVSQAHSAVKTVDQILKVVALEAALESSDKAYPIHLLPKTKEIPQYQDYKK